ncbi:MAG: hypothetical protein JJE15_10105 [Desulfobacteraceae bacterium]|nr:hypothetical protein [Desulfobacteraceae bacterium]
MENRSASLECEEANSYLFGASTSIAFAGIVYLKGSVAFCFAPSQRKAKNRSNPGVLPSGLSLRVEDCASVVRYVYPERKWVLK